MKIKMSFILKQLLVLALVLIVLFIAQFLFVSQTTGNALQKAVRTDLKNIGDNVYISFDGIVRSSIENYLKAMARANYDIVSDLAQKARQGLMSQREARRRAREILLSQRVGETGYIYVLDSSRAPDYITPAVHPKGIEGRDVSSFQFVQDSVSRKEGYFEYMWKNPGEEKERPKSQYVITYEPWNWVIAVSSYKSEFYSLVNVDVIREQLEKIRVGEDDYITVIDQKGEVLMHPYLEGKNIYNLKNSRGVLFIKEMLEQKNGWFKYYWKRKEDSKTDEMKLAYLRYYEDMDWLIIVSVYEKQVFHSVDELKRSLVIFYIVLFILIMIALSATSYLLAAPLRVLEHAMRDVASGSGDLSKKLNMTRSDEFGMVARSFDHFLDNLSRIALDIKKGIANSRQQGQALAEGTVEVNSTIDKIQENISRIQEQFDQLSQNISTSSAAVNQISATLDSFNGLIENQSAAISESGSAVEEIMASVNNISSFIQKKTMETANLVKVTEDGNKAVKKTNAVISGMGQETERVTETLDIINNIASQTNLLAMNAAIEAAHAGEAGKGFDVVAEEIRKLSENTSDNTHIIAEVLENMTNRVSELEKSSAVMDDSFQKIQEMVRLTNDAYKETARTMDELAASSKEVLEAVSSVNSITSEVKSGSEEIRGSTTEVAGSMNEVNSISSRATSGLKEIVENIRSISSAFDQVTELSKQSSRELDRMQEVINQFKTE